MAMLRGTKHIILMIHTVLAGIITISASAESSSPIPISDEVRKEFQLDEFYQKQVIVMDLPIVGSKNLSDFALKEAAWIVDKMCTGRSDILRTLAKNKVRLAIMAWNEFTTDLPEQKTMDPKVYWDRRARGLGGAPVVSAAEENILCFPGDPYAEENILIHEFAHVIHGSAMKSLDSTFDERLRESYRKAKESNLWQGTYAMTNPGEYWAEGVQCWFDDNRENDALHNHVNTRGELKDYDPDLAFLCEEVFGNRSWRYRKPQQRNAAGRQHLDGFDHSSAPEFRWREAPITANPEVSIETAMGRIKVRLEAEKAPITTRNFLRYVLEDHYSNGIFFRTVTEANQSQDEIQIAVIQARADPKKAEKAFPPIQTERTSDTGIRHLDGTLSMARMEPDTETHHFFICVGDQPELDYGGKRNPDGQGFSAFGKVIEGMDLVRRIHSSPAKGQLLDPPIRIQRAIRIH